MSVRPVTASAAESALDAGSALRRVSHRAAMAAATGLLYFTALELGVLLRFPDGGFAALWPANAVLLSALMLTPPRRWWLLLIAVAPAHFAAYGGSGLGALRLTWQIVHNCALTLAAAGFLRVFLPGRPPFRTTRDLTVYVVVVVLVLPAAAALGAPGTFLAPPGSSGAAAPWTAWRFTWLANAINFLALVPAIVLWGTYGSGWLRSGRTGRFAEGAAIGTLTVTVCVVAFTSARESPAALYALLVPLFWASARFGAAGVTTVHFVMALLATSLVVRMGGSRGMEGVFDLQLFLVILALPMLFLAVLMDERAAAATQLRDYAKAMLATERSLREHHERFQLALRATDDVIFDWDIAAERMWWSANGERLLGRHVENLRYDVGWWSARLNPSDRARVIADLQAAIARRAEVWEVECRFGAHAGSDIHVHARGLIARDRHGRPLRMIGSLMDITDRMRLEEVNRRLAHAGRLMVAGELMASIAHEINQPLTAILNNAEAGIKLLESAHAPEPTLEILEDIRRDDVRASQVISRLRSWLTDRRLARDPVDIDAIVRDVERLLRPEADRRGVRMETALGGVPTIHADQIHMQQVLLNLMVNGMEAMAETPAPLRRLIVQTGRRPDGWVAARVIDHGCGIPAEKLPRLFDSFYTSKPDGMGIGLSIVRSIVHLHGGRISATNNPNGPGATFTLELPGAPR